MKRTRRATVGWALFILVGCDAPIDLGAVPASVADAGSSALGTPIDASTGFSVEQFCAAFNDAFHRNYAQCWGGTVDDWAKGFVFIPFCGPLADSITRGRVVYDEAKARDCIDQLHQKACETNSYTWPPDVCLAAVQGRLPAGQACRALIPETTSKTLFNECAAGTYCASSGSPAWKGTCTPFLQNGDLCAPDVPAGCGPDLECSIEQVSVSLTAYCVPIVGEGSTCRGNGISSNCGPALFCDNTVAETTGTCRRVGTGTCNGWYECANGYFCQEAPDGSRSCVRYKSPGDPCDPLGGPECSRYCRSDGTCGVAADVGETCGAHAVSPSGFIFCRQGLYCEIPSGADVGTCAPQVEPGGACQRRGHDRPQCAPNGNGVGYCDSTERCAIAEP